MNNPNFRFTGIFIPVEVLELEELTLFEERLLAIIDSLYCKEHGGCFASNEYLAKKMKNAKVNTVVKALIKLRKLKLIEDISFNGRKRILRACISEVVIRGQSHADCDLNHMQTVIKITPSIGFKSQSMDPSPIYERKEYKKEEREEQQVAKPTPTSSSKKRKIVKEEENQLPERAPDVHVSDEDHKKLISQIGLEMTNSCYQELSEWKQDVAKSKWKKSDYRAILKWVIDAVIERQEKEKSRNAHLGNKNSKAIEKPVKPNIVENRAISERIRGIVDQYQIPLKKHICLFEHNVSFTDRTKGLYKTFPYDEDIKVFRNILLITAIQIFPRAENEIKKLRSE